MLTVGSLFSGIGGLELGLERAGMTVRWQVEINRWCRDRLQEQWPEVRRYEDVGTVGAHNLERVDLICGGFPCQPVSIAGKRLAQDDERWLWPEFALILGELRPRYAVLENVPGLLSAGFGDVLGDLASLGFDAEWSVLSACALGAPHTRERLFVVAYANGERCPELHLAAFASGQGQPARSSTASGTHWEIEPQPVPVVDGVSYGVAAVRAFGNAVVPQASEYIGRRIVAAHSA